MASPEDRAKFFDQVKQFFNQGADPSVNLPISSEIGRGAAYGQEIISKLADATSSEVEHLESLVQLREKENALLTIQAQLSGASRRAIAEAEAEIDRYIKKLENAIKVETPFLKRTSGPQPIYRMKESPMTPGGGRPTPPLNASDIDPPERRVIETNLNGEPQTDQGEVIADPIMSKNKRRAHKLGNVIHDVIQNPLSVTSHLTGLYDASQRGGYRGASFIKPLTKLGVGAAGFGAAVESLPYALGGIENLYGRVAGGDIRQGQRVGFSGSQGSMAFGQGIYNRYIAEPLNLLSSITPFGSALPFVGSEAARFGAQSRLESFKAGFNPFDALSIREAEGIRDEVQNRGYRAGTNQYNSVVSSLQRLKNTTGLDPGQALDYIDLFVKRLGGNVDDITKDLETFGASARAAGKSVDEYTKEVSDASKTLLQANVAPNTAQAIAAGAASFNGISADTIQGISNNGASNPFFLMQAMNKNPDIFNDPAKTLQFMANPASAMGLGTTATTVQSVRSVIDMLRQQFPGSSVDELADIATLYKIPGMENLTGQDISQIYKHGDEATRAEARTSRYGELNKAFGKYRDSGFKSAEDARIISLNPYVQKSEKEKANKAATGLDSLYNRYGTLVKNDPELTKDQKDEITKMIQSRDDPSDIESTVNKYLGAARADQTQKEGDQRYMLDATPELKKYFRLIDKTNKSQDGTQQRTGTERNSDNAKDATYGIYGAGGFFGG